MPRCGALSLLQKDAALQGGSIRNRCRLNVQMCDLRGGLLPLIKAAAVKSRDSETKSRRVRGCWFVLLFRTLPPAAPPASPVTPVRGMIGRVLYTAAVTRPAGPHTLSFVCPINIIQSPIGRIRQLKSRGTCNQRQKVSISVVRMLTVNKTGVFEMACVGSIYQLEPSLSPPFVFPRR